MLSPLFVNYCVGALVSTWKLYGAVAVSASGLAISLFILLVHFDTVCHPQLWRAIFRDGSKGEYYLLMGLFLFWVAGLQICTSSLSVGEAAPNVYFTTWIAFGSVALNLGVWRKSAELPGLTKILWDHPRETFHNWFFVWVFSMINSLAIADLYASREDLKFLIDGYLRPVTQKEWIMALSASFSAVALSAITMICNHYWTEGLRFKACQTKFQLDWRQVEGLIALILCGIYSWIIVDCKSFYDLLFYLLHTGSLNFVYILFFDRHWCQFPPQRTIECLFWCMGSFLFFYFNLWNLAA